MADPRLAGRDVHGLLRRGDGALAPDDERALAAPLHRRDGSKNACIVTARGDLERAATGIVRFGLRPQRPECSALSRLYVRGAAADALLAQSSRSGSARSGRATRAAENWMGPVINEAAADSYEEYCVRLRAERRAHLRGRPSASATSSRTDTSWPPRSRRRRPSIRSSQEEMFQPILMAQLASRTCARAWRSRTRARSGSPPAATAAPDDALLPRPHRGGRHLRQPAAGRHHRRPARSTSPSAAGRARARQARRSARRTTCRSTCASSRRPSWSEATKNRTSARSFRGPRRALRRARRSGSSRPPIRASTRS